MEGDKNEGQNDNPWVVVGLLWFVALLNYLNRQMLATMKPSICLSGRAFATT
ncbi:hypothetical protein [Larkinella arboricola]